MLSAGLPCADICLNWIRGEEHVQIHSQLKNPHKIGCFSRWGSLGICLWSHISLLGKNRPLMAHLVALHRSHLFCRLWASWGTYFTVRSHCLCYGYSEKVSSVKFFKYINVKDSHSRRKHDTTAPEAAYNTSPGQNWACHCLIMDGWIHKLNYWLLVDSEGGEVIVCICVPMHESTRF